MEVVAEQREDHTLSIPAHLTHLAHPYTIIDIRGTDVSLGAYRAPAIFECLKIWG